MRNQVELFMAKKQFKMSKGITLVALVITIVILIILAVITINFAFGDNGLIKQAEKARDYQANADVTDSKLLNDATEYIDGIIGGSGSGGGSTEEPTTPSTVEDAKNNGDTFGDTTIIKDDLDNDVTIPGGFHVAEDSGIKVEEGIVIEDDTGNQFVWIPVGEYQTTDEDEPTKTNNLSRRTFTSSGATEVDGDNPIDGRSGGGTVECYGEGNEDSVAKNQIESFKTSATTHRGFYIGRYEAGTEVERTSSSDELTIPLVQANKNAYAYVTRDQAKAQSEAMYSGNEHVTSELISSYAWDTALNFICQNNEYGYNLATTMDSTHGNIGTNKKELTGAYVASKYNNIYDLIGNIAEWTTEYADNDSAKCVGRGGSCFYNNYSVSDRGTDTTIASNRNDAFRVQLYVK